MEALVELVSKFHVMRLKKEEILTASVKLIKLFTSYNCGPVMSSILFKRSPKCGEILKTSACGDRH